MADINKVILVGRLTRDAELRYTNSGAPICKFSIAINRRKKVGDQWEDEANFFDCVLFGRQGESINQYLVKGKQVGIDGELRQNRWEQDGQSRSKVEITAYNVMLLGGGRGGGPSNASSGGFGQESAAPGRSDSGSSDRYSEQPADDFDDDIPF